MVRFVTILAALSLFGFLSAVPAAHAQDKAARREAACAALGTKAEIEICLDRDLTRRDAYLNEVYLQLKKKLSAADFKALRQEQREWLKDRNRCGAKVQCLKDAYTDRLAVLEQNLENLEYPNKSHVEIGCGEDQKFVEGECINTGSRSGGKDGRTSDKKQTDTSNKRGSVPATSATQKLTCDDWTKVRSDKSGAPVTIKFVNKSDGYRGILWINKDGTPIDRSGLNVGEAYTAKTQQGHIWMFTDGPGNCIEMYAAQSGIKMFHITTPSPIFGPEND
jgi:uncharacterized protein